MDFQTILINAPLLLFAFARIVALIFSAPILNSTGIPTMAKTGLALALSVVSLPFLVENNYLFPDSPLYFFALLLGEIIIGVTMGFIMQIYFAVFQTAGQLFSGEIGLSMASTLDPAGEEESPVMGQLFNLMAMYLFLSNNGLNKLFFNGLYLSFIKIRPQDLVKSSDFLNSYFVNAIGNIFAYALQIALPIIIILLLVYAVLGLLTKVAPQLHLLMLGLPLSFGVGILFIYLTIDPIVLMIEKVLGQSYIDFGKMFAIGGQG